MVAVLFFDVDIVLVSVFGVVVLLGLLLVSFPFLSDVPFAYHTGSGLSSLSICMKWSLVISSRCLLFSISKGCLLGHCFLVSLK